MTESERTRAAVEGFLDAFESADFARIAALLASDGFSYEGPIDRFDEPAAFVQDLEKYALILKRIERRRLFVDGSEACAVLTFLTSVSDIERTRVVVWVRTDAAGRIVRIESFLDVRAYARMFEAGAAAKDR
ncbi:MAG: nuclear transport factor 2 family protein [Gammaproteobacteria bacterium]